MSQQTNHPQAGDPEELLGLDAASELLGVTVEQVRTMVEQGIITAHESGEGPGYRRAELIAARELGG